MSNYNKNFLQNTYYECYTYSQAESEGFVFSKRRKILTFPVDVEGNSEAKTMEMLDFD